MEGILGKVRGPHPPLTLHSVREQPPLPDSDQPLHHLPGPAPPFTSRLSICMSLRPSPYCSLCLELLVHLFRANSNACLSSSPGRTPEENRDPCRLWFTTALSPVSFYTPCKHFNSQLSGVETVWPPKVANIYAIITHLTGV